MGQVELHFRHAREASVRTWVEKRTGLLIQICGANSRVTVFLRTNVQPTRGGLRPSYTARPCTQSAKEGWSLRIRSPRAAGADGTAVQWWAGIYASRDTPSDDLLVRFSRLPAPEMSLHICIWPARIADSHAKMEEV